MPQPTEDDTPFSAPSDTPDNMPVDHPAQDSNVDPQEAYDEGPQATADVDPYSPDDDPVRSTKQQMTRGGSSPEYYTINHDVIRRWAEYRYGHPARITGAENGLDRGGLYITFEDDEPDIEVESLTWGKFFQIFEKNKLALVYRTKTKSGARSRFYTFMDRGDVGRVTEARKVA